MGQSYTTINLYLAGFLMARSHPLTGHNSEEDQSGRKSVRFSFIESPQLQTDVTAFQNNGRIKIGEYTRAMSVLKGIVREYWGPPGENQQTKGGTENGRGTGNHATRKRTARSKAGATRNS
jgi:hypothetical protein